MKTWKSMLGLLRPQHDTACCVEELTAQRERLEHQLEKLNDQLSIVEEEEREGLRRGVSAPNDAERRQVARKLLVTRRHLKRLRTQATGYSCQASIIGTHIHHLTLSRQLAGSRVISTNELAEKAALAEQAMADLAADADLAATIEVGVDSVSFNDEEAAILIEFQQVAEEAKETDSVAQPAEPALQVRRAGPISVLEENPQSKIEPTASG